MRSTQFLRTFIALSFAISIASGGMHVFVRSKHGNHAIKINSDSTVGDLLNAAQAAGSGTGTLSLSGRTLQSHQKLSDLGIQSQITFMYLKSTVTITVSVMMYKWRWGLLSVEDSETITVTVSGFPAFLTKLKLALKRRWPTKFNTDHKNLAYAASVHYGLKRLCIDVPVGALRNQYSVGLHGDRDFVVY